MKKLTTILIFTCILLQAYGAQIINNHTVWTSTSITEAIIVDDGGQLEIDALIIDVGVDYSITVKKGGFLAIKNSSLRVDITAPTYSQWGGIIIEGNGSGDPHTINVESNGIDVPWYGQFGAVYIFNSTIEYTQIAITSNDGGMFQIEETDFKNNVIGIQVNDYVYEPTGGSNSVGVNNSCNHFYIEECTFTWDDKDYFDSYTYEPAIPGGAAARGHGIHIDINDAAGVKIMGSDFDNEVADVSFTCNPDESGIGVNASEGQFFISKSKFLNSYDMDNCPEYGTSPELNTFMRLSYGVKIDNQVDNYECGISDVNFNSNHIDIDAKHINGFGVRLCDFEKNASTMGNHFNYSGEIAVGVRVRFCNEYAIWDNDFTSDRDDVNFIESTANRNTTEIVNNTFNSDNTSHLDVQGIVLNSAYDFNTSGTENNDGIEIICNEFTDLFYDIH